MIKNEVFAKLGYVAGVLQGLSLTMENANHLEVLDNAALKLEAVITYLLDDKPEYPELTHCGVRTEDHKISS